MPRCKGYARLGRLSGRLDGATRPTAQVSQPSANDRQTAAQGAPEGRAHARLANRRPEGALCGPEGRLLAGVHTERPTGARRAPGGASGRPGAPAEGCRRQVRQHFAGKRRFAVRFAQWLVKLGLAGLLRFQFLDPLVVAR